MLASYKRKKRMRTIGKILFLLYIAFIIYFLIFSDFYGRADTGEYRYNLVPFREILRFWAYRDQVGFVAMFTNVFGNVLIFIPFGFFLPMASKYRSFPVTLLCSFGLSLGVEVFQFFTKVGSFDVDDLILNTLGGVLGYFIFAAGSELRRHRKK